MLDLKKYSNCQYKKYIQIQQKKGKVVERNNVLFHSCFPENRCTAIIWFLMSQGLIDPSFVTVTEKNPKIPLTVFSLPPPFFSFLHSLSFTIHYKCVTGYRRVERREQCVVTLNTALQLSAWLQLPLPAGCGGPGHHPSAHLLLHPPPPPPQPESIALRHHTNDPLKSMHHSTVHHHQ